MKRKILIVLLALGTLGGYGFGFAHLLHARRAQHDAFERHVARVCLEAAREAQVGRRPPMPPAPPMR